MDTFSRLTLVLLLLLASAGCIPVRVVNTPALPIPVAPMAIYAPQADGTTAVNPQLGPPPTPETYEQPRFNWGKAIGQAASGNWMGLAGTALAGVATLYGTSQRRRRKLEVVEARDDRDRLASQAPEEAEREIAVLHRKEKK